MSGLRSTEPLTHHELYLTLDIGQCDENFVDKEFRLLIKKEKER